PSHHATPRQPRRRRDAQPEPVLTARFLLAAPAFAGYHRLDALPRGESVHPRILRGAAVAATSNRPLPPLPLAVCSWSLQVGSMAELKRLLNDLGTPVTQIACGDPHHASWEEGDRMPQVATASGLTLAGAMLGFPGEDYTTPQTIKATGGFGDPKLRPE